MDRKEILELIISAQEEMVENLEQSVKSYAVEADIDESDGSINPSDLSNQSTAKDMQLRMELTLSGALNELEKIKQLEDVTSETAIAGSVVETKDKLFFLGSGITKLPLNGKELLGVSIDAPAYAQIFGKKKGDTFKLADTTYEITDVY